MLITLEVFEFLRALDFPGSDVFVLGSIVVLFHTISKIKLRGYLWVFYAFLILFPILHAYASKRFELAIIGFNIAIFFFFCHRTVPVLLSFRARLISFLLLVAISYVFSIGSPVYYKSKFNSLFFSGNAFINYLLIVAFILAIHVRGAVMPALVSIPLVLIQTKTVVVLFFSNLRFALLTSMLAIPLIVLLGTVLFDRIAWMLQNRGLIYALTAGRFERLTSEVTSLVSWERLFWGVPFEPVETNFEIEYVDMYLDFGLFYTLSLYLAALRCIYKLSGSLFLKVMIVFLVLNLSGHFWNNTIVVVAILNLIFYANTLNNKHVS